MFFQHDLKPDQIATYDRDGFLVLENFVEAQACDRLRGRAAALVSEFNPKGLVSIFSTPRANPHQRRMRSLQEESNLVPIRESIRRWCGFARE